MLDQITDCISEKAYHRSKEVGFSENAELQYIVGPRTVCVFADPGGRDEFVSLHLKRNPDRFAEATFARPHSLTLGPFMLFKYKGIDGKGNKVKSKIEANLDTSTLTPVVQ